MLKSAAKSAKAVNQGLLRQPVRVNQSKQQQEDGLPRENGFLRRVGKRPEMMHYNRLIALVMVINMTVFGVITQGNWITSGIELSTLSNMVVINIALAILIRQQYVINLLFKMATSVPTSWPLSVRALLGKVYHFGGIHVGGAIMGTVWFAAFMTLATMRFAAKEANVSLATLIVTYAILALLLFMIGLATPKYRANKYHDLFEQSHRFAGWASLLLFWAQTILFANDQRGAMSLGDALLASVGFWLLLVVTVSIALPWLRLRKVPVQIERPSNHVVLANFGYGVTPFAGSSTTISRNPLMEWHAFANVPSPGKTGYRLTISRAGDWTGALIDDMPSQGAPKT